MVIILLLSAGIAISLDISRHHNKTIQGIVDKFFASIMREEELSGTLKLSGVSYMFLGFFISAVLFSKGLAIASFLVLIVSDTLAAIVGKQFGSGDKNDKSVEGAGAFFVSSVLIGALAYTIWPYEAGFFGIILASFSASAAEYYSKNLGINDNLVIPLTFGLTISFISIFV
jgi:dolichol kinase